jgi:hypothetical protein
VLLAVKLGPKVRLALIVVALAALFAAPATWAAETLGHATSGTFPMGGPANVTAMGGGGSGFGGHGGRPGAFGAPGAGAGRGGPPSGAGFPGASALFGGGGTSGGGGGGGGPARGGFGGAGFAGGGGGAFGGDTATLQAAITYARAHGGGTIGVASQSSAAAAILSSDANVAGLGGFSGRESSVTAAWLAAEVRAGHLRWVVIDQGQGATLPGDTRTGSEAAMDVVAKVCRKVTFTTSGGTRVTMYDCYGRAAAILSASKAGAT